MKMRMGALFVFLALANTGSVFAQSNANDFLVNKARSLEGRGRSDLASQTWQQVLLADPNHQEALAALARFAKQSGKTQESQTYLARLRKLNPNHPALQQIQSMPVLVQQQARLREAASLAASQQFDQAMQIYRQVFGDEPPAGAMAIAYYETQAAVPGGFESATAGLRKLMDAYPAVEDYRLSLGRLWTYRPAARLAGIKLLEGIQGSKENVSRARQAWRQALVWEGANSQIIPSARAYVARYPDPEISKMLEGVVPTPHVAAANVVVRSPAETLGYAALKANNVKEADTQFQAAVKDNPKSSGALSGLGFVRLKQENFSAAESLFEAAVKESPKDKDLTDALETARFWGAMKDASDLFAADRVPDAVELYRKALSLRPASPEAMHGLGGALMKAGDYAAAASTFEKITEQQPQNDEAWFELLNARYHSAGADSALAATRVVPSSVRLALAKNIRYLAMMAAAASDVGKNEESKKYLHEAIELANVRGLVLPAPLQLQFAGLYLRHGYTTEAAAIFQKVVDADANNIDAWEGLITALIQTHQEGRASRLIERMPAKIYQVATTRPSSLRSLAAISTSLGQLEDAEAYLQKSIKLDTKLDDESNLAARLQLAHIWLAQGRNQQAESLLRGMTASHPDSPGAWKALVSALHNQNRDDAVLVEDGRIPQSAQISLTDDPDYISLLAASVNALGRFDEALRYARRAAALMKQQNRPIPADLDIQLAWLLLNTNSDERELYSLLNEVGARTDLSQTQQTSVSEVWSTWMLRRASAAANAGDYSRAVAVLEAASRMLPKDTAIRSSLAGVLLQAGETNRALNVYRSWGMGGASASDYAGAIGGALAANDVPQASLWLRIAVNRWPGNANILNLAGKVAAAQGDYKTAQSYWRAALAATPSAAETASNRTALPALKAADTRSPAEVIGELLWGNAANPSPVAKNVTAAPARPPSPPPQQRESAPAPSSLPPRVAKGNPPLLLASAALRHQGGDLDTSWPPAVPTANASTGSALPRPGVPGLSELPPLGGSLSKVERKPQPTTSIASAAYDPIQPASEGSTLRNEIQDRLNAVDSRNSSFFGTGGSIHTHNGETGFDRMILEEANLEASNVFGNGLRVSVIAHPTYIDSGLPDGTSERRFGLAPKGASFGTQSVSGFGGEVQVSTQTFGLRVGSTPRNFLVSNFVGGIRFRPANGPITLFAERDVLRDSMLSFAGVRDPVTNRVWGGVIADSFGVRGNWGGAKSGFYTSFDYQNITGTEVQSNSRIDGNLGMYWRVLETPEGKLTAGFNLAGMHYDKNLRYFTLGHGGYFSPQQYVLASVPVQWRGTYNHRVQYSVDASFGTQHFEEDASPYFPTLPAIQGRNGPYYIKQTATGANYNVDVHSLMPITPVWYIGTFANLNNTRNFTSAAAGVTIRFTTRARSVKEEFNLPSVPDWRGVEPFRLY